MKNLSGLWKDESYGLLIHLLGAVSGNEHGMRGSLGTIKAVARVAKGRGERLQDCPVTLVAILPRQSIKIRVISAYQYNDLDLGIPNVNWKSNMWKIEAVVIHEPTGDVTDFMSNSSH